MLAFGFESLEVSQVFNHIWVATRWDFSQKYLGGIAQLLGGIQLQILCLEKLVMRWHHHLGAISWPHWRHCSSGPLQQSVKLPSALVTPKPVKAHLPPPMVSSHFIASRPSRAKCWLYKLQVPHWNWLNWGVPWQIFQQLPCNIVGIHLNHANIDNDPLVK